MVARASGLRWTGVLPTRTQGRDALKAGGTPAPLRFSDTLLSIPRLRLLFLIVCRVMLRLPRIIGRIARGYLRIYFLLPRVETFAQFDGLLRHLSGQVALLPNVLAQVVKLDAQVIENLGELKVAFANRPVRCGAAELIRLVMGIIPEQLGGTTPY